MQTPLVEMTGERFGSLVVLRRASHRDRKNAYWLCRCDCGAEKVIMGGNLRHGRTRSCGCQTASLLSEIKRKHGLSTHAVYKILSHARSRCRNPQNPAYRNYGGRGIEFRLPDALGAASRLLLDTIGERPDGYSLDRIDNDGHYEIGNLRWATPSEQARNRGNELPDRVHVGGAARGFWATYF